MRFPRLATIAVAIAAAAVVTGLSAVPGYADQVRNEEWWLSTLGVTNAMSASQGAGVKVAVLSDGVDGNHPDLVGSVTAAPAIAGAPVATGQFFGEQGTGIASLIAGHGHGSGDGSGIIGIAPKATILSVPVTLPADDPQLSDTAIAAAIPGAIAAGIRYAVNHGASVIDLPIDPGQPTSSGMPGAAAAAGGSAAEQSAVNYALAHNVVLVAPAGDNNLAQDAPNFPAAYKGVIAVGAFNSNYFKTPWTSHQSYVTLTAPGSGVIAAANNGSYQTMNSTSAASAIVAGTVALIRSRYPDLSVADVRTALITTTLYQRLPTGLTDGSGYGALDTAKALGAAALLATPAKDRAGADAQPVVTPGPAAAGKSAATLSSQIMQGAKISLAVLVVLLLLVAGYALIGRLRPRKQLPALDAEWRSGQTQSRYPHVVHTEGDRMLEYFAAPVAPPQPLEGQPAGAALPDSPEDDPLDRPGRARDGARAMPASRPVMRRPVVSGAPPWEPASPPDGEPPWPDVPGRLTVPGQVVASGYPAGEPGSPGPGPAATESDRPAWTPQPGPVPRTAEPGLASRPSDRWRDTPRPAVSAAFGAAGPDSQMSDRDEPARSNRWSSDAGFGRTFPAAAGSAAGRESPVGQIPPATAISQDWSWPGRPDSVQPGQHQSAQPSQHQSAQPAQHQSAQPAQHQSAQPAQHQSAQPAQHRSGLPVRQPRLINHAQSPSGSLWERPQSGGSLWERASVPTGSTEPPDPEDGPNYAGSQD